MREHHHDFLSWTMNPASAASAEWLLPSGVQARWLDYGIVELAPVDATDSLLLSCGVHGNETAPVEVLNAILADIAGGKLALRCRLLVVFGNLDAMRLGKRYLDYDMNRLFNGAHARQPEAREAARAARLEQAATDFFAPARGRRWHYDLHTAIRGSVFEKFAIYPYTHERPHSRAQLAWLKSCEVETVLLHSQPANTYSYFTSHHCQADAFTLELGKARPFGDNDLSRFTGIELALRRLLAEPEQKLPDYRDGDLPLFRAKYDIVKHSEAFRLHLADAVENFTVLPDGYLIAEDGEHRYVAAGGEERILFPNPTVKPGLRAGIVVAPAQLPAG